MYIPIYKWAPGAAFVHGPQGRHQNETVELNELLSSVTGRGGWGWERDTRVKTNPSVATRVMDIRPRTCCLATNECITPSWEGPALRCLLSLEIS